MSEANDIQALVREVGKTEEQPSEFRRMLGETVIDAALKVKLDDHFGYAA